MNAFALKEEDVKDFIEEVVKDIKMNQQELLDACTFGKDDIIHVSKVAKVEKEEENSSNSKDIEDKRYQINLKVDKYPQFYFYNLKNGKRDNGIKCFISEAIKFICASTTNVKPTMLLL